MTEKWNIWLCPLCCLTSLLLKWYLWLCWPLCLTSLLLKWYLWLHSLRYFTSLFLKWYLWLHLLRCKADIVLPALRWFSVYFSVSIEFLCATVISRSWISVDSYIVFYPLWLLQCIYLGVFELAFKSSDIYLKIDCLNLLIWIFKFNM